MVVLPLGAFKINIRNLMTRGHWKEMTFAGRIYTSGFLLILLNIDIFVWCERSVHFIVCLPLHWNMNKSLHSYILLLHFHFFKNEQQTHCQFNYFILLLIEHDMRRSDSALPVISDFVEYKSSPFMIRVDLISNC